MSLELSREGQVGDINLGLWHLEIFNAMCLVELTGRKYRGINGSHRCSLLTEKGRIKPSGCGVMKAKQGN